jgi:UDP-GlcNAc:undecaprenyl-phosphate GlcNAc-1-phosphate transferase
VLVLLVPIFDTALVSIARTFAGRPISLGGRDHTSHRLVALGLSEREAVLLLYSVSIGSGIIALLSYRYGLSYAVVLVALLGLGMMLFGVYLGRLRVYPEEEARLTEGARFVKLVADFPFKRQVATVLIDLLLIVTAYYTAYLLRFESTFPVEQERLIASLPIVITCQLLTLALFRGYRGLWRYTSLGDLIRLVQAATVGTAAAALALLFVSRFAGYSRTVFVLDWLLLIVLMGGSRLAFRAFGEFLRPAGEGSQRVLIYGAGEGGVMLVRELRHNPMLHCTPVGFVDDDRGKQRTRIQDVPVLGGLDDLPRLVDEMQIDQVIVSSRKISPDRLLETRKACEPLGASVVRLSIRLE